MNIKKIDSKSSTVLTSKASFSSSEIKDGFKKVFDRDKSRVKIPGFRPGKAPYSLFKSHVGIDYLKDEFIYDASRQALSEMIEGESYHMVGNPEVKIDTFDVDKECVMTLEIQYIPDFELPDPAKFKIKVGNFDVTDKEINSAIDRLRLQHATMTPIDRLTKEKDFVYFKWCIVENGEPTGRWKEELVEVGKDDFVKGFDKNLTGVKSGETKRVKAKLSGDDKPVEIELQIGETKTADMPKLDDEFAKTLSMETVDALKSAVKAELDAGAKRAKYQEKNSKLAEVLLEKTKLEIPEKLIIASVDDELARMKQELSQKGLTLEIYLNKRDISEEKLREELTPRATSQAKIDLILEEFANKEKIEPEDNEIEVEFERYKTATKQMKKSKRIDDETLRNNISSAIKRNKTLEFLLGKAGLKEE